MTLKRFLIPLLSTLVALGWDLLPPAQAADGAAPPSQQRRVLSGIHTDAIAVFAESDGLVLGTQADLDGNVGVRMDPNLTVFNVEESRRTLIPHAATYAFLGTPGSDVWIAPESNPGGTALWPGFSTEGVPGGMLDGNQLTFRLETVTGPGTLHIFQHTAFGEPLQRLTGTGTEFREWTVPHRTHAHANWAFSAAGHYTLTFIASAMTNGVSISATQTYTFIVGNVPEAAVSATTLAANTRAAVLGTPVNLTATVTPANAVGWVEFMDGTTILGHDAVNAGAAQLTTTQLLLGARSVTARFIPQWLNDFSTSTSPTVVISVAEPGGVLFGITGVTASYPPGDTLHAQVTGHTLQAGQQYRWQWRVSGLTDFELGDPSVSPLFTRDLSVSDNGYELSVSVWFCEEWDEYCIDGTIVAQSPWVPVSVLDVGDPIVATLLSSTHAHLGDEALITVGGRTLAEGETLQVVRRDPATGWHTWSNDELFVHEGDTMRVYLTAGGEFAIRVLDADGLAVTQSAPMAIQVEEYEVQIAGVHGLYRPGANLLAQGIIHPESTHLLYQWSFFVPGGIDLGILKENSGPGADTLELPNLTLAHNAGVLFLSVSVPIGPPFVEEEGLSMAGQINVRVYVQDIDPGQQIFQFQPLPDHYHQGNDVNLVLGVDPVPALGDQIVWDWKWPGGDWVTFPGADGARRTLVAEQALDGMQVRASLVFADTNAATLAAGPLTIFVDDHGAPPFQQPTVAGATSYTAGDLAALTRQLPAHGSTILTTHRWERKAAVASEFVVIPGATNATLSFTTAPADDGAEYRVSILKPNGDLAYGPSPAVTLDVEPPTAMGFEITGIAASYQPGQTLNATAVGFTLGSNQEIRWVHELPNKFTSPQEEDPVTGDTYVLDPVDAFYNGHRLWATIWDTDSQTVVSQTPPVTIHVEMEGSIPMLHLGSVTSIYLGDTFTATACGLDGIPADATVRAIYSYYRLRDYSETTDATFEGNLWTFPRDLGHLLPDLNLQLQVMRDGLTIAASPNYHIKAVRREVLIQGAQSIYREGQTLSVSATVFPWPPADNGATHRWYFRSAQSARRTYYPATPDVNGEFHFEHNVLLVDNNGYVAFEVMHPFGTVSLTTASARFDLKVPDASQGEQLVAINNLAGHYHQGGPISLVATADPAAADTDVFSWEWQFPGSETWSAIPGISGQSISITAEQALDGVKVRVNMIPTGTEGVFTSLPVTILVDDHGAAARQQPTIAGVASYTAGELATLTRQLPANGPTILSTHRWERKAAGAAEYSPIAGESGATLTFTTALADDGAAYSVSILKPDGSIAYGPSPAVTLDVEPGTSADFSITGIAASYRPGDILEARVAGVTLEEGQEIRWFVRPIGTDYSGTSLSRFVPVTDTPEALAGNLSMVLDVSFDGYELHAALVQGDETIATTAWVGLSVPNAVEPLELTYDGPTPFRVGETAMLEVTGRELAEGETLRLARQLDNPIYNLWVEASSGFPALDDRRFALEPTSQTLFPLAVQVVREGVVVAQSGPLEIDSERFEVFFEGMQPVYRAGQTFRATMTAVPDLGDRITYTWAMYDDYENPMEVAAGEEGRTFEMPVTADMDGERMFIQAHVAYESGAKALIGGFYPYLTVTDQEGQLFLFAHLGDHYHQGAPVDLNLTAAPGLAEGDSVTWQWRWPGTDWETFPEVEGLSHQLIAEQAMDGLEVRATLNFAGENIEHMVAGPVTIFVDDHGAAAWQQLTIAGVTSYTAGELVTLTRQLPANGPTILTTHRWERKAAGVSEFSPIPGQTGESLLFTAALEDDGAEYRVSILKPNDEIAYGPSPAIAVTVRAKDLTLEIADGTATLALTTQDGVTHQLESAPEVTGPWSPLGDPINGTGQTVLIDVWIQGPGGFFRWRTVANP